MRFWTLLVLSSIFFVTSSCTEKEKKSKIYINFDPSVLGTNPYPQAKALNQLSSGDGPSWALPDPSSLGDIHCYGIFVHGSEQEMSHSTCVNENDQPISFGPRAGFFPIGQAGELEVIAGENRTIYLAGMSSGDGTCQSGFDLNPNLNESNHSNPFIIGQATVNLVEGDNVVEVPIENSFNDSNKIKNCDFFQNDDESGSELAVLVFSQTTPFDFGGVLVTNTANHIFTVSNVGSQEAQSISDSALSAPFAFTGGSFPGTSGDCNATLAVGASCTLDVEYAPVSNIGASATMNLSYFDGDAVVNTSLNLQGTGLSPAVLGISETLPYNYGILATGAIASHTFTMTNSGDVAATAISETGLAAPFSFTGGSFPGTGGDCTTSLAAGNSCNLVIEYAPTITGANAENIDISYNDGLVGTVYSHGVQGTGATPASLSISESDPYSFGTVAVGSIHQHTFTLTNTGGVSATSISEISLGAPYGFTGGAYPGTSGDCGVTLAAGSSCNLDIEYAPTVLGPQVGYIDIQYDNGVSTGLVASRTLNGTGAAPALLTISDGPIYDYGSVAIGVATNHTFTVTNTGGVSATGLAEAGIAAPFSFTGGSFPGTGGNCGSFLASGASCTMEIEFNAPAAIFYNDLIDLNYNDGVAIQNATRNIQGTGL